MSRPGQVQTRTRSSELELGLVTYRKLSMISSSAALPGRVARRVERRERLVHEAEQFDEVLLVRLDVEDAGRVLAARGRLVQQRRRSILSVGL